MSVWAIVVAGGLGSRFGGAVPKPLADLAGRPVILRTLDVFEKDVHVQGVVLVVHRDWKKDYEKVVHTAGLVKLKAIVSGGDTRTQSVRNGLAALAQDVNIVMVHDGVRPLLTSQIIAAGLQAVKQTGAAITAVAAKATIKAVDPNSRMVTETFDRDLLWEVQTPQVFDRILLERAYREDVQGATDDAFLVERLGVKVVVFDGAYTNIKITTPEDILVAKAFQK